MSVGIASSSVTTPENVHHSDSLAEELFQSDLAQSGSWQEKFLLTQFPPWENDSGSRDMGTSRALRRGRNIAHRPQAGKKLKFSPKPVKGQQCSGSSSQLPQVPEGQSLARSRLTAVDQLWDWCVDSRIPHMVLCYRETVWLPTAWATVR